MRKIETRTTATGTTYVVRFRHGISKRTGKRKQTSEAFDTRKEAVEFAKWLDAIGAEGALRQLYEGDQIKALPTLDDVAAAHIEHLPNITDGTRLNYTRLWARTWSPRIGALPINMVTRDAVSKAIIDLARTYSSKSLKNQRGLLAGVCQRAVDDGMLEKNPTKRMPLPRGNEHERVEMRILTRAEIDDLLDTIHPHYRPFVMFLVGTGARWGEAVALQVRDVDPPSVRIRRALKWSPDNDRQVGPTKTVKSNRTINVPQVITDAMDLDNRPGDALVFTAPKGGPIQHRTFWSDIWCPAVSDLTPRPRIHDLRHTYASHQLANGTPLNVVQRNLGHESIQTTVDTYSHLLPEALAQSAAAAELMFRPLPKELE